MKKKLAYLLAVTMTAGMLAMPAYAAPETETSAAETEAETEAAETQEVTAPAPKKEEKKAPVDEKKALEALRAESTLAKDAKILDGIFVDQISIGGMTAEEALDEVMKKVDGLGEKVLTLTLDEAEGTEPIKAALKDLGLYTTDLPEELMEALSLGKSGNLIQRFKVKTDLKTENKNYDLNLEIQEKEVKDFLDLCTDSLATDPVNAEISFDGGSFTVSQSQTGIKMDPDKTLESVLAAFEGWNQEDFSIAATAEVTQPARTTEMLSKIKDRIGSFSTSTSTASEGKLVNLRTGVRLTTGTLIMPGETWSMHAALSPFNAANGYTVQIAYQNGGYVQEYGGGICQLATTLYNAALRAEVNVAERHNHSMTVGYTYPGLDATINDGGSKDLKLTNDFDFPIYIVGSVGGGSVTYNIYGVETRPGNRSLKFYGEYTSYADSGEQRTVDHSLPPGTEVVDQATAYPTAKAVAYKEVYVDGNMIERITLHHDSYRGSARKVRYNPAAPAPAPTPAPVPETPAPAPAPVPETPAPTPAPAPAPAAEAPAA